MPSMPASTNPWLDTPQRYGRISRILHWSMALLFAWQFAGMILKVLLGWHPRDSWMLGTHAHVGFALLLVLSLRAAWALGNLRNRPSYGSGFIARCAGAGHCMLYVLMLLVPATALLRQYGSGRGFTWLGQIPVFAPGTPQPELVARINGTSDALGATAHGFLGWLLLALIVGHIAMVLVHHCIWKDDTARRMLGASRY
ncbi:hypothetical protein AAV94_05870 [Lampropedia cohaerens]|uniref:Cytochrome b561 bacterial/Ni-hydrogenase domain-containing protein n=2 Tax=Lampropedia cohaerens TaxID=1610491 RepID=A0A0U1Q0N6_9BURK|nr:hypothetical protein AAV94_05870 [Lampropedia cohaerens]